MKELLQKILFREDRMPARDDFGWVSHPDTDIFLQDGQGNLVNPSDEGFLSVKWLKELGFGVLTVSLEEDVPPDHPARISYEAGDSNLSGWDPVREGWKRVAIHDTDDGPQALFVQSIAGETIEHFDAGGGLIGQVQV